MGVGSLATARPGPRWAAEETVSGLWPAVPDEESSAASHSAEAIESMAPYRQRRNDHSLGRGQSIVHRLL